MFLAALLPVPQPLTTRSSAFALKERLEWGEPALTIIDVRSGDDFHSCRIRGAISIPIDGLVARVSSSLEHERDIYIDGDTDRQTAAAAAQLRDAGYRQVAELLGGVSGWRAIKGPTEGAFSKV